jgi:hypothetical protein
MPVADAQCLASTSTSRRRGAPSDPREARVVPHPDFTVLIVPARTILANVRAGEAYATACAREGLVVHDDGSFRNALIALEEEGRLD